MYDIVLKRQKILLFGDVITVENQFCRRWFCCCLLLLLQSKSSSLSRWCYIILPC